MSRYLIADGATIWGFRGCDEYREQGGEPVILGSCEGNEEPARPSWSDMKGGTGNQFSRRSVEDVSPH